MSEGILGSSKKYNIIFISFLFLLFIGGAALADIDACVNNPCAAGETCTDIPGGPDDPTGRTCADTVNVRFGVFTDTHTYYNPAKYPDKYENAENKLVPVLKKFKEVNESVGIPFVVHLGDLYEDHASSGTPAANISYTERYLDHYSCRLLSSDCFDIYLAMGNHDSNMSNSGVDRSYIGTNLSNYYLSDDPSFARYDYDWVYNEYRFIIIDSSQNGSFAEGEISEDTLTWLSNTLANARDSGQSVFIFLHHRVDDSDSKATHVIMWSPQAHYVRKVLNDSGAIILGVFMGHNHINDSRSSQEVKGWPDVPENNWYKVPLQPPPSRGDLVTEDGIKLSRGTGSGGCSGIGVPGTWDWHAGIFCYSPGFGSPFDHQVDVFGKLDDYSVNYYEFQASSGSMASSPTSKDESGAIVEVTGTDKTGVVIHGFAEMANYHTPYTAYISENGKDKWDPDDANDTYASGSIYDPFPTMKIADSRVSSYDKPATFLIQSGHIRESGTVYPKGGTSEYPRIWTCENGAKITNATNVSDNTWSGPDQYGWYTLTLANVGTVSEDDNIVQRYSGYASSESPNATPQWDLEGTTLYYNPSSGMPSDHLVEAGTYSSVFYPIAPIEYLTISGPCVFYGARYRGISFYTGHYNNVTVDGVISERNGEAGVYIAGSSFTDSAFSNIISRNNTNYGFYLTGVTNPILSYVLAYNNSTAGLYANSTFAGTGASLTIHNATFAKNNTGIFLSGTGDTGGTAYTLDNIIVDSTGNYGIMITAATATGAITNSYINQNSGANVWGALDHSNQVAEGLDPNFLDKDGDDFRLNIYSGCIDTGTMIPGLTRDIARNPIYGIPDIGAYEFQRLQDADLDDYSILIDCDDNNPEVHPGAIELCDNIDNNCNSIIDEGFEDADHDGYKICLGDCDDSNQEVHPGAVEVPYDGIDQDCTGTDLTDVDEDGFDSTAAGGSDCDDNNALINPATNWYIDSDDDEYGNPYLSVQQCMQPEGYVLNSNDCNDNNPDINLLTTWHPDFDYDNYGSKTISLQQCSQPSGYLTDDEDCDDSDPNIYPGGPQARIIRPGEPLYYSFTLQGVFDTAVDGDIIQIQQAAYAEDLLLDANITITHEAGFNCDFTSASSAIINGNLTISNGTLVLNIGGLYMQ